MELKGYQSKVMRDLASYMDCVNNSGDLYSAWRSYWAAQDIAVGHGGVPNYNNAIARVPHVCMKVPTGGGKTFMACAALRRIFEGMPSAKPRVVVWLVPSDSILAQTTKNLSNPDHPYRQRLDADFAGRVGVYTKEMLLNGQNFSPDTVREMLTVCVLSYSSLRIDSKKKDVRKVYQENGNLLRFAEYFKDDAALLADTPDTALIQVLRHLEPVAIVDESHNAGSDLSVEMLNNLNPSFVLDLTATPRKNSNIISYVDARELKKENMVKLPVVVYNRTTRYSVIQDAINLCGKIEQQALAEEQAGGAYIRPIVLFQAQPKTGDESETFDKIKAVLLDMGIPAEQIAVKTSKVDDLGKTDLMSRDCPVRYIITVNALKEGWDCPFAYILASLANKTSQVDVEQILGRILRQPYAKRHTAPLLNASYVFTCSKDFQNTLENIVKGLNRAGFTRKDYRVGESEQPPMFKADNNVEQTEMQPEDNSVQDTFDDIHPAEVKDALASASDSEQSIANIEREAQRVTAEYEAAAAQEDANGFVGGELGEMLNQNAIQPQFREQAQALIIPQFVVKNAPDMFSDGFDLLTEENLSDGFRLTGQDAQVSFELATGEMYSVDIAQQGEAVPKYQKVNKLESDYIRQQLATLPPEEKKEKAVEWICHQLNRNDHYATAEISDYVRRIVANMTNDELAAMETSIPTYAQKIRDKIKSLVDVYCEKQFYTWLDCDKIVCREKYTLPLTITPADTTDAIAKSLYEAERNDMNNGEHELLNAIVALDNVLWWHRIIDRNGFYLNGFINHYPDFMVMTTRGHLVMVEYKGDNLDNSNSRKKLSIGKKWEAKAGSQYKYFMVFKEKEFGLDGAYKQDEFVEMMKKL